MPERTIQCPSGLAGRIRGLKGREMNLLGDKKAARSGELFDNLLRACWLEMEEPGPYTFKDSKIDWSSVLVADRFFTLIQLRLATYPDEPYGFKTTCQNQSCTDTFGWQIKLDELPVKALPLESLEVFKSGGSFSTTHNGRKISFRLTTGKDEKKSAQLVRGSQQDLVALLNLRILEVEGVDVFKKKAWLEDLEMADLRDILADFDTVDGGVETSIEVECPSCNRQFEVELPFDREFFLPKRK